MAQFATVNVAFAAQPNLSASLRTVIDPESLAVALSVELGTSLNQATKSWLYRQPVPTGAGGVDIDLSAILDVFGTLISPAAVVGILCVNRDTAQDVTIKPSASNGFTPPWGSASGQNIIPKNNGVFSALNLNATGSGQWAVSGTVKSINLAHGGLSSVNVDVMLLMR